MNAVKHSGADRNLIDSLDILIEAGFDSVLKKAKENITIGEFLKMVDMREKLSAKMPGNKEFWDMLDRIRKEQLGNKKLPSTVKQKQQTETVDKETA
ncbi:MAG: hypothetical protein U9N55_03800 [candidate division Zixibacteria bacterium]|nr:hypothetical protein [candidate division Zixibacteria bacterium]